MPTGPYFPDGEMVTEAWIKSYPFEFSSSTNLPLLEEYDWSEEGHILIAGEIGGEVNRYSGMQRSIVQIESWAYRPDSAQPPWWLSSSNLQHLIRAGNTVPICAMTLDMPDDYYAVRIMEMNALTPGRRRNGDLGGYACHMAEFELVWVPTAVQTNPFIPVPPDPTPVDLPNLIFNFTNAMVWHVVHNLHNIPLVSLLDEFDDEMEAEIDHVSDNEFYVYFNQPTTGKAVVGR